LSECQSPPALILVEIRIARRLLTIARPSDAQVRELLLQQLDRRTTEPGAATPSADAVSMVAPCAALFVVDRLTSNRDPRLFGPVGGRVAHMSSSQDVGELTLLAARAFVDFLALAVFALVGSSFTSSCIRMNT
jgi:hypothetical protein